MEEYSLKLRVQKIFDEISMQKQKHAKIKRRLNEFIEELEDFELRSGESFSRQQQLNVLCTWLKQEKEKKSRLKVEKHNEIENLELSIESIKKDMESFRLNDQEKLDEDELIHITETTRLNFIRAFTNIYIHSSSKTTNNLQGVVNNGGKLKAFSMKRSDNSLANKFWDLAFTSSMFQNEWNTMAKNVWKDDQ